jgi:hypothetical protein
LSNGKHTLELVADGKDRACDFDHSRLYTAGKVERSSKQPNG